MKRFLFRFSCFWASVLSLAAAERDIVRTFPAPAGCSISIDTFRGRILVAEAETAQVRIAVHLEIGADDEAEADRMVASLQLAMEAAGPVISVTARDPRQARPRFVWDERKQLEPTFRLTVPKACNLDLKTRTGAITVGDISGVLRAESGQGDVFFRHAGGSVEARTSVGDVVVSHCDGSVHASTALGTIRLGRVTGRCEVENRSGDVEIQAAVGTLRVRDEAGNVAVGLPAEFSGAADITTNGGAIVLTIDPAANCDVTASTSIFSHIESRLPLRILAGRVGGRRLVGRLNQGGVPVVLRASGGNIRLLPGPPS